MWIKLQILRNSSHSSYTILSTSVHYFSIQYNWLKTYHRKQKEALGKGDTQSKQLLLEHFVHLIYWSSGSNGKGTSTGEMKTRSPVEGRKASLPACHTCSIDLFVQQALKKWEEAMKDKKCTDDLICVSSVEQEEPNFNYLNDVFLQENPTGRHFSVIYPLISSTVLFTLCIHV